jgi:hypothetical protein
MKRAASAVVAGLVPAIHDFIAASAIQVVDARPEGGHDRGVVFAPFFRAKPSP